MPDETPSAGTDPALPSADQTAKRGDHWRLFHETDEHLEQALGLANAAYYVALAGPHDDDATRAMMTCAMGIEAALKAAIKSHEAELESLRPHVREGN